MEAQDPRGRTDVTIKVEPAIAGASPSRPSAIGTSFQFAGSTMDQLQNLATRYNTTVDKLLARAVATEVFLDDLPKGSKLVIVKPNGTYEEMVRPNLQDIGK